jgi:hypothetical protein
MDPLDAFWHLVNFVLPALGVGALGAAGAKLLWRRELAGISWLRLAGWASTAGVLALLLGLWFFGRDGKMATYAALVLAAAAALWWVGFGRRGGKG